MPLTHPDQIEFGLVCHVASAPGAQGVGLTRKRAPGIHCMCMREQRWNFTAAMLFLVMIVHAMLFLIMIVHVFIL